MADVQIGWRASRALRDRIDAWADKLMTSRNAVITQLVTTGLDAMDRMEFKSPYEAVRDEVAQTLRNGAPPNDELPPVPAEDQAELDHALGTVEESGDVWGPKPESKHWHSFDKVIESTVEYRNGIKFATLQCECGKLSPDKSKVRIR